MTVFGSFSLSVCQDLKPDISRVTRNKKAICQFKLCVYVCVVVVKLLGPDVYAARDEEKCIYIYFMDDDGGKGAVQYWCLPFFVCLKIIYSISNW